MSSGSGSRVGIGCTPSVDHKRGWRERGHVKKSQKLSNFEKVSRISFDLENIKFKSF